jgi:predicted transcriptional regulator
MRTRAVPCCGTRQPSFSASDPRRRYARELDAGEGMEKWASVFREFSFAYSFQFAPAAYDILNSYTEATAINFNIYLDDETGRQLNRLAKQVGESRNALVRQAVSDWLNRHGKPQWPDEVLAFKGMADMPLFEASRDRLKPPIADPLA